MLEEPDVLPRVRYHRLDEIVWRESVDRISQARHSVSPALDGQSSPPNSSSASSRTQRRMQILRDSILAI
jgi:hypothetical protein